MMKNLKYDGSRNHMIKRQNNETTMMTSREYDGENSI
jgi:hypothetical protein